MALVDSDYCFIFADSGCQGRLSDGAVFRNTELYRKIENHQLLCPPDEPLPGRNNPMPYLFVGDDAFGLCKMFFGKEYLFILKQVFNIQNLQII